MCNVSMLPENPKPKKERVERMRECFFRMFSVRRDCAEIPDLPKCGPVTASELHVQSAIQGTALSLVLRLRSMCFPLKCFLLNVP